MKTIPIPLDGSMLAGGAPGPADHPAERFGAELLLGRVINPPGAASTPRHRHARVEPGMVIELAGWIEPAPDTASRTREASG